MRFCVACLVGSLVISAILFAWGDAARKGGSGRPDRKVQVKDQKLFLLDPDVPGRSTQVETMRFLSLGDQGTGGFPQRQVAAGMTKVAQRYNLSFVLGLGDNFYDRGLYNEDDPLFRERFEDMYNSPELENIPWYMSLGDHDHRRNVDAQVQHESRSSNWHMDGQFYTVQKTLACGCMVHIVVTDSVLLEGGIYEEGMSRRFIREYDDSRSGKEAGLQHWEWLQNTLARLTNKDDWVIVIGHRPIISRCKREVSALDIKFRSRMKKLLEESSADLYMNGHDHTAQILRDSGLHYVVNGIGGHNLHKLQPPSPQDLYVDASFHGFALHSLGCNSMTITFYSGEGKEQGEKVIRKRDFQRKSGVV